MVINIIIFLGFIITVYLICKIWNVFMMRQYNKSKSKSMIKFIIDYDNYIDGKNKLILAGTENDNNNDYEFIKAVKKINLSEDVRIKIYD